MIITKNHAAKFTVQADDGKTVGTVERSSHGWRFITPAGAAPRISHSTPSPAVEFAVTAGYAPKSLRGLHEQFAKASNDWSAMHKKVIA